MDWLNLRYNECKDMSKPVILTGLRANNDLTLGNYFGGLLPIIDMAKNKSNEYQINLFVPDLHSFTTPMKHSELQQRIWSNLRLFVAAGLPLDSTDVLLYRQSYVPAHSELTWILDCFTGMGEMGRMIEYKEKSAKIGDDRVSVGLFNYPVLMAADILLYNSTFVPVGDDQRQHLEFARDIAQRMNNMFNDLLTIPKPIDEQHEFFGKDQGLRIKDLADPTKKMSKSDETGKGVIFLSEDPEFAAGKIMRATTDDLTSIKYDPQNQPGISNLIEILALTTGKTKDEVIAEWKDKSSYGDFKQAVADAVRAFLTDFQAKLAQVSDESISAKLETSEVAANTVANETLLRVQKAVGLR